MLKKKKVGKKLYYKAKKTHKKIKKVKVHDPYNVSPTNPCYHYTTLHYMARLRLGTLGLSLVQLKKWDGRNAAMGHLRLGPRA